MSLETMAKSPTYYSGSPKPTSQPMIHDCSLDSKAPATDASNQKNPAENSTSPEASVVALSEASSTYKYETSSEGDPQRIQDDTLRPINPSLGSENDVRIANPTLKPMDKKSVGIPNYPKLSKSLSVLRQNVSFSTGDDRLPKTILVDRIVTQSSHARFEKLKNIIAYVESTSWPPSDNSAVSEIAIKDFETVNRSNDVEKISGTVLQESHVTNNKTRGVTFLTMNKDIRVSDVGTGANKGHQHYHSGKYQRSLKPARIESAIGRIDDLIGIAENPNPSMKSIYFPPDPDNHSTTSELRSDQRDSRNSRTFSRNRSDLDALSRIEDELIPLQNEFSKLVGKVRTLNLPEMSYSFHGPSSVISCDTSGYFLHRAQVFCRNDSPRNFAITRDSQLAILSTADNSIVYGASDTPGSCIWQNNLNISTPRQTSRVTSENRVQLGNNEVRFFQEKPLAYGIHGKFSGSDDGPEKPMCFVHTPRKSHCDRFNRYHWSHLSSTLPTEGFSQFHSNFDDSVHDSQNDVRRRGAYIKESIGRSDRRANNFSLIDDKIQLAFTSKNNVTGPRDLDGSCSKRDSSTSHKPSDGIVTIDRVSSRKSQCCHRSGKSSHTEKHRRAHDSGIPDQTVLRDEMKNNHEHRRSMKSTISANPQKPRNFEINQSPNEKEVHRAEEPSFSIDGIDARDSHTADFVVSQSQVIPIDLLNKSERLEAVSSSGLLEPSRENLKMCESELSTFVDGEQIKFVDSYTEHTIVMMESNQSKARDSSDHKDEHGTSENRHELEESCKVAKVVESSSDHRNGGKHLTLPVSEEKITIVPVMYTSRIPETIQKFDLPICRRKKFDKRSSHRHRSMVEKVDKLTTNRPERLLSRKASVLSSVGSHATTSFTSQMSTHFTDENSSIRQSERPWLGQWRKDSRLLISYSRSNTAISVSSTTTTINAERTLNPEQPTSRTTESPRSRVSLAKPDLFSMGHDSSFMKTTEINDSHNYRRRTQSPMKSARRGRTNESSIGVRISPDDCLDDA